MTALLEVKNLKIEAPKEDGPAVKIVKDVSFNVKAGEVVALIGESGSGKTTISLGALAYTKPGLEFSGGETSGWTCGVYRCKGVVEGHSAARISGAGGCGGLVRDWRHSQLRDRHGDVWSPA